MRFSTSMSISSLFALLPLAVFASPVEFNYTTPASNIEKRSFDNVRITFYDISVGT